jgi:hypothetical protein
VSRRRIADGVRALTEKHVNMKKKTIIYVMLIAALLAVCGIYGLRFWVYSDAIDAGREAQIMFPGDAVEALIARLESDETTVDEKNRAVWALGQMRDARAVPVLEPLTTGESEPCDHSRLVCQYELKKALANCRGETFDLVF